QEEVGPDHGRAEFYRLLEVSDGTWTGAILENPARDEQAIIIRVYLKPTRVVSHGGSRVFQELMAEAQEAGSHRVSRYPTRRVLVLFESCQATLENRDQLSAHLGRFGIRGGSSFVDADIRRSGHHVGGVV